MGSVWKLLLECGFQSWSSVLRAMLIKILDTQVPFKIPTERPGRI